MMMVERAVKTTFTLWLSGYSPNAIKGEDRATVDVMKTLCLLRIFVGLILCFTQVSFTQTRGLEVGDPLVNTARLAERADTLQLLRYRDKQEMPVARLFRSRRVEWQAGKDVFVIVQRYASGNVDTSIAIKETLMPVYYSEYVQGKVKTIRFSPNRMFIRTTHGDSTTESGLDTRKPLFNAITDDELIESLPLKEDYRATWSAVSPTLRVAEIQIEVEGSSLIKTAHGILDTWLVKYNAGAAPTTMWVSKTDGHILWLKAELRDGSEFWKIPVHDLDFWRKR